MLFRSGNCFMLIGSMQSLLTPLADHGDKIDHPNWIFTTTPISSVQEGGLHKQTLLSKPNIHVYVVTVIISNGI